jgi:hypothetical protein
MFNRGYNTERDTLPLGGIEVRASQYPDPNGNLYPTAVFALNEGQTNDLTQWTDSSGSNVLARIDVTGKAYFPSIDVPVQGDLGMGSFTNQLGL